MIGASLTNAQRSLSTSSWLSTGKARPELGSAKMGPPSFPGSGKYLYSRELIQQAIQDTATVKFRRVGPSSKGVLSGALLSGWVTNVGTVGASNHVSALFALGRVVWALYSTSNALSPGMVRTG
jgi:hypothetical protein